MIESSFLQPTFHLVAQSNFFFLKLHYLVDKNLARNSARGNIANRYIIEHQHYTELILCNKT